jgi:hypothetical protein
LPHQNKELKDIVGARRENKKARQVVLEGQIFLMKKELIKTMIHIEDQVKKKKR